MAAKTDTQKTNTDLTINTRLSGFIQNNRKAFLIGLIAVVVIIIGFVIVNTVRGKILSNALSQVDTFERRYNEIKPHIGSNEPESLLKLVELAILSEELNTFAQKTTGFAAARIYGINANIFADQKRWAEAEEAWSKAAQAAAKSYLAPFSIFNAAVAAEEQGNIDSAISYYTRALNYGDLFPSAARAQFSVGRLEESRNNKDAALEAYRNLLSKWPNDPVWPNLAQNRILILAN